LEGASFDSKTRSFLLVRDEVICGLLIIGNRINSPTVIRIILGEKY